MYASISGTNDYFKDIMGFFEPIITDNESNKETIMKTRFDLIQKNYEKFIKLLEQPVNTEKLEKTLSSETVFGKQLSLS